uniref:Eukaryotic translation initiation factor 5B-like n=1 Tax=Nicotiana sylvestris TaxID=4096 RepID=A0A1U7XPC5_NICSY|nr:PREDICTED: eukaryotic translation initiation factor 5B-like [Nicotiana sylvestris]
MAKTSKTDPQKEKASSSSSWLAGDKTPVEPLPHEYVPGPSVARMRHAVPDLKDWVRKLAVSSSHAEHCWRNMSRGRWEAKNHESVYQLGEEEEDERDDSALVVRARRPVEAGKPSKPEAIVETRPRDGEASKKDSGKAPESLEAFTKSLAELSQFETELQKVSEERNNLKLLCGQKDEAIKDLRSDLAKARKEEAEIDEQLQQKLERIELLQGEVNQIKADCDRQKENMNRLVAEKEASLAKLSSSEDQLRSIKEKSSAQAKRIEELEVELVEAKEEVEKMKSMADKSIAVYLADAEAAHTQLSEAALQGFDLSNEIAQDKVLEADTRLLVSSDDDDDDEGSQGGSDNDEGPEREAAPKGGTSPGHS